MSYPTSSTTGVPSGVTLTPSGDIIVTKAGTVLEGLDIRGSVTIRADNVTIKNCKITFNGYYGVYAGAKDATIVNCDITSNGTGPQGNNGIQGTGTFLNNDIRGVENGIAVWGSNVTIRGNYIHDLKAQGAPHYDGVQVMGDFMHDVVIEGNTIIGNNVSAVMLNNELGSLSNIFVRNNYLAGGGFPLYQDGSKSSHPMTNIVWQDNYVAKGVYGYEYLKADSQGRLPIRSGNVYTDSPLSPEQVPNNGSTTQVPAPAPTPAPSEPAPAEPVSSPDGAVTKIGTGSDALVLKITQKAYQGDSQYAVFVDGKQIGGILTAKALLGSGQADTVEIKGDWASGNHTVTVKLLNDLYEGPGADRNVYVESATYNGAVVTGSKLSVTDAWTPKSFTVIDNTSVPSQSTTTPIPSTVTGTSGNDTLAGSAGGDSFKGLGGNDTYTINHSEDTVIELANEGRDLVNATVTHNLATNVEDLTLLGEADINGTGNGLNNVLLGNTGRNILRGGNGDDIINGRGGADVMWGDGGNDTFQFTDKYSANGDMVMDFVHGVDKLEFNYDANGSVAGNQSFVFAGYISGGQNGQIWAVDDLKANVTHLYAKVDGFVTQIDLTGTQLGLTKSDFLL